MLLQVPLFGVWWERVYFRSAARSGCAWYHIYQVWM